MDFFINFMFLEVTLIKFFAKNKQIYIYVEKQLLSTFILSEIIRFEETAPLKGSSDKKKSLSYSVCM